MPYLLDSNTFIQAKNEYYAFRLCPGFWDWIDRENHAGTVFSIEPVLKELRDGNDELVDWAKNRVDGWNKKDTHFFKLRITLINNKLQNR